MIGVIFEVWIEEEQADRYLEIATELRQELEKIDGFVSIERFQSLSDANKLLSLSFWEDESVIEKWRNLEKHRAAQAAGRGGIFRDYKLRVAAVIRDYGMNDREQAPEDSRKAHS